MKGSISLFEFLFWILTLIGSISIEGILAESVTPDEARQLRDEVLSDFVSSSNPLFFVMH